MSERERWERLSRAASAVSDLWDDAHGIVLLRSRTADGLVDRSSLFRELRAALRDLPERPPLPVTAAGVVLCDCGAPYRVPNAGPCPECGAARRLE